MLKRICFGLSAAALFFLATTAVFAQCPTQEQLRERDEQVQWIKKYGKDPKFKSLVAVQQKFIDEVNRREANCKKTTPKPPQGEDPCVKTRRDIESKSTSSRDSALEYVSRNKPGKNGFFVRYNHPPAYCGGPWTAANGPYYMKSYDAVREIKRLATNGNQITSIGKW